MDAAENESARSEAATFTTLKKEEPKDTEAPSVPTAVAAADITQTTAKVTWEAFTFASFTYTLYPFRNGYRNAWKKSKNKI